MRILHLVHHTLPWQDGYALRTRHIARVQALCGHQPIVATLPGIQKHIPEGADFDGLHRADVEGICHYYQDARGYSLVVSIAKTMLRAASRLGPVRALYTKARDRYYGQAADRASTRSDWMGLSHTKILDAYYGKIAARHQPLSALHAHTPFLNATYAAALKERYGIPYVYEVRGLWEDTYVSSGEWQEEDDSYAVRRSAETHAMREADAVVAISAHLRDEIVGRGVQQDRTFVVPNGVDTSAFNPQPRDVELTRRYDLANRIVLGYIGSLRELEGLDLLVMAMPDIVRADERAACLIVGDGPERSRLRALVSQLSLDRHFVWIDPVPHSQVDRYYSLIDVFVLPRTDTRVNQMVTPLKPLEAMCMGKAVLASNMAGLTEILQHHKTGFVFQAGNHHDLTERTLELLQRRELRDTVGRQAREWVLRERDWHTVVQKYDSIYGMLLSQAKRRADPPQEIDIQAQGC